MTPQELAGQPPAGQDLAAKSCEPCRGGIPPMDRAMAASYLVQVPGWVLKEDPERIERDFRFPDFAQAQAFATQVGNLCELEGHHAEIRYGWGHCSVAFWTHKIKGLHENDFVMAAKVNGLSEPPYVPASVGTPPPPYVQGG